MVVGIIGDALATSIFEKSQFNLTSVAFAEQVMSGKPYNSEWDKDHQRHWTITNRSQLLRSGYKMGNKRQKRWEVGYEAPYAYATDRGAPPHVVPFEKIYEWAWYRKNEIKALKPYAALPSNITTDSYQGGPMSHVKMAPRAGTQARKDYDYLLGKHYYDNSSLGQKYANKHRNRYDKEKKYDQVVFDFAFWVWYGIKRHGVEPSFFFSDAVYVTKEHATEIITNAFVASGRVKVVS